MCAAERGRAVLPALYVCGTAIYTAQQKVADTIG